MGMKTRRVHSYITKLNKLQNHICKKKFGNWNFCSHDRAETSILKLLRLASMILWIVNTEHSNGNTSHSCGTYRRLITVCVCVCLCRNREEHVATIIYLTFLASHEHLQHLENEKFIITTIRGTGFHEWIPLVSISCLYIGRPVWSTFLTHTNLRWISFKSNQNNS